jgi:UDP-N-acetyl-D-glucosamine dehydrogenase
MPEYVVHRLQQALNERGKSIKGSKLLILGLAYKKDIGDTRESPAYQIIPRLIDLGAEIAYHDSFVPAVARTRHWPEPLALVSRPLTSETIVAQDAVLIITDHTSVDYELIAKHAKLIIDSRGVYRKPLANVVKA